MKIKVLILFIPILFLSNSSMMKMEQDQINQDLLIGVWLQSDSSSTLFNRADSLTGNRLGYRFLKNGTLEFCRTAKYAMCGYTPRQYRPRANYPGNWEIDSTGHLLISSEHMYLVNEKWIIESLDEFNMTVKRELIRKNRKTHHNNK